MMGQKGDKWRSAAVNVRLKWSDQVRLGQRPFHIHVVFLIVNQSMYCILTTVVPQHLLVFLRNVDKVLCVSNKAQNRNECNLLNNLNKHGSVVWNCIIT